MTYACLFKQIVLVSFCSPLFCPQEQPVRSEERRVGKSVDLCVTGVQTCALPIYLKAYDITLDDVCLPFQADSTGFFLQSALLPARATCCQRYALSDCFQCCHSLDKQ